MQEKFYLDACVWRDFFEDRQNHIRPLGELVFQFLKKCRKEKHKIIVSDIVLKELHKYISQEKTNVFLSSFSDLIITEKHSQKQLEEAETYWKKTKKKFPLFDILHSIIARDSKAILVSRDKHFYEISIVKMFFPEELL